MESRHPHVAARAVGVEAQPVALRVQSGRCTHEVRYTRSGVSHRTARSAEGKPLTGPADGDTGALHADDLGTDQGMAKTERTDAL